MEVHRGKKQYGGSDGVASPFGGGLNKFVVLENSPCANDHKNDTKIGGIEQNGSNYHSCICESRKGSLEEIIHFF